MISHIKLLNEGQIEAAQSLGLTQKQVFSSIVMEQTLTRTYPSILEQFIVNVKQTAIFSIIRLLNLQWMADKDINMSFDITTPLIMISVIYLGLVSLINLVIRKTTKNKI
ncbi:ABC transporter permease subunit ['Camptotheca acuminata' phytoplasma]|uniref:ABC transporter permease subunit n=1 Tax='Camptotheca acuminata' phytoplasma TaxID=3239192 RepID=UPI00351A30EB